MILHALIFCLSPIATDGDTLRCNDDTRIRLWGVDSQDRTPQDAAARLELQRLTVGGLACKPKGVSYNRIVAVCTNGQGVDVGGWLITQGYASEWCKYSKGYYGRCAIARR